MTRPCRRSMRRTARKSSYLKLAAPNSPAWKVPPFRIADFDCDPADVAAWDTSGAPPPEESPIFIVGFPRSGTTLLEQTLDAHASLASMDETRYLYQAIDRMAGEKINYPRKLADLSRAQLDLLRNVYWQSVRRKIDLAPGQRLVDKNPLNMLALPAIRRLFPNSRILLAIRHPCDVVLSCYMQHFTAPDFILLCRNLQSLAAAYVRAFDFWNREASVLQAGRPRRALRRFRRRISRSQVRAISRFPRPRVDRCDARAGRACAQQGLHQHAELQPGGAAGQHPLHRSLEILRKALCKQSFPSCSRTSTAGATTRLTSRTADTSKECTCRRTPAAGPRAGTSSTAETSGAFPGAPRS